MNDILHLELNEYLTGFIEYKWEEFMASIDFSRFSDEQLVVMKTIFHLGYQQGYEDNYEEVKGIYKRDRILLIDLFEED